MAVFQYVNIANLDNTQAQFTFTTVNSGIFLRFGLLNSDDTTLLNSLIAGGRVGFFVLDVESAGVNILARNDVDDGLAVESMPSELAVGSNYEIKFTQARPGTNTVQVTIPGARGLRGNYWTADIVFPSDPLTGDLHLFTADVADGLMWFDTDGTTPLTTAIGGDIAKFNGTAWVKLFTIPLAITPTNVLAAIELMTDMQKMQIRDVLGAIIVEPLTALTYSGISYDLYSQNDQPEKCFYVPVVSDHFKIEEMDTIILYEYREPFTYNSIISFSNDRGADYNSKLNQVWAIGGAGVNRIHRHNPSLSFLTSSSTAYPLNASNVQPRGAAHIANIDEFWVVDYIDRLFYRHSDSDGSYIGTYPINENNASAGDMTYLPDIREVWVLDLVDKHIYRYNTTGDFLGVFTLTADNADPTGIMYVQDMNRAWIPDGTTLKVYLYETS